MKYFDEIVNLMDNDIREQVAAEGIETEEEFLKRYCELDEGAAEIIKITFGINVNKI